MINIPVDAQFFDIEMEMYGKYEDGFINYFRDNKWQPVVKVTKREINSLLKSRAIIRVNRFKGLRFWIATVLFAMLTIYIMQG